MPLTTYIFDKERIKGYSKVEDKELRELRDEIWHKTGTFFYIQKHQRKYKKWFRWHTTKAKFSLLAHIHSCEYQILNFATENDSGSYFVDKCHIVNYFNGMLGGLQK